MEIFQDIQRVEENSFISLFFNIKIEDGWI